MCSLHNFISCTKLQNPFKIKLGHAVRACVPVPAGGRSHLTSLAAAQFVARGKLLLPQRLFPRLTHVVFLVISGLKIIIKLAFALKIKVVPKRFSAEGNTVSVAVVTYFPITGFGLFLDTKGPNISDKDLTGRYLAIALVNRCTAYIKVHMVGATSQWQRGRGGRGGWGGAGCGGAG